MFKLDGLVVKLHYIRFRIDLNNAVAPTLKEGWQTHQYRKTHILGTLIFFDVRVGKSVDKRGIVYYLLVQIQFVKGLLE